MTFLLPLEDFPRLFHPQESLRLARLIRLLRERQVTVTKHVHSACLELALNPSDIAPSPPIVLLLKSLSVSEHSALIVQSHTVHLEMNKYIFMQGSISVPREIKISYPDSMYQ